ncbi:MAG: hypothetical protein ACKPA8_19460, partial [Dolichospermum sp.]
MIVLLFPNYQLPITTDTADSFVMKYIIATSLACGEGVGGGVILYLITSVSAVISVLHKVGNC